MFGIRKAKKIRKLCVITLALICTLAGVDIAHATDITTMDELTTFVSASGSGDTGVIKNDISKTLTSQSLAVKRSITIIGDTANEIINLGKKNGFQALTDGVQFDIKDLTLTNSSRAIYANGKSVVNINNVNFDTNTAKGGLLGLGAAIYNYGSGAQTVTVNKSIFNKNVNTLSTGGAIYNARNLVIGDDTKFTSNSAATYGGALYATSAGEFDIKDTTFDGNHAKLGGGAIYIYLIKGKVSDIADSTFKNNYLSGSTSDGLGGAIGNARGTLNIKNTSFESNTVTNTSSTSAGGAIYNYLYGKSETAADIVLNITDSSSFKSNTAQGAGGAIANFSTANIKNTTFTSNSVTSADTSAGGGAIFLGSGSITSINASTFTSNTSALNGGAIGTRTKVAGNNDTATLDITNSTFTSNSATNGGAIDNYFMHSATLKGTSGDAVYVANSTFSSNSATTGGAIYNHDVDSSSHIVAMTVKDSVFSNNTASQNGGAIYNEGTLTLNGTNVFLENGVNGAKNDIYNTGKLNLNGTTTFDGGISGNGTVNLGGNSITSFINQAINASGIGNETVLKAKTLDVADGAQIAFDWGDTIDLTNDATGSNLTVSGIYVSTTVLNDIGDGDTKSVTLFSNTGKAILNPTVQLFDANKTYTLSQDGANIKLTAASGGGLKSAAEDIAQNTIYQITGNVGDTTVLSAQAITNNLTISGDKDAQNILTLQNNASLTVGNTNTLTVSNVDLKATNGGTAVASSGTLVVNNGSVDKIANSGTVNFNFTSDKDLITVISDAATPTGITNISVADGATVNLTSNGITQDKLILSGNGHLTMSGSPIVADITNKMTGNTYELKTTIDGTFTNTYGNAVFMGQSGTGGYQAAVTGQITNTNATIGFYNDNTESGRFNVQTGITGDSTSVANNILNIGGTYNSTDYSSWVNLNSGKTIENQTINILGGKLSAENGTITNSIINIAQGSILNAGVGNNLRTIDDTISNLGTLSIKGDGTNYNKITGNGQTTFLGTITQDDNKVIENNIHIVGNNGSSSLTTNADNIGGNVTLEQINANDSTLTLTGGTLSKTVAYTASGTGKGKVNIITDTVTLDTYGLIADAIAVTIDSAININGASLTLDSNDTWNGAISLNNGNLTLSGRSDITTDTQTYNQSVGTLTLDGSSLALNTNSSKITGGTVNVNNASTIKFSNGVENTAKLVTDNSANTISIGKTDGSGTYGSGLKLLDNSDIKDETLLNIYGKGYLSLAGNSAKVTLNEDDTINPNSNIKLENAGASLIYKNRTDIFDKTDITKAHYNHSDGTLVMENSTMTLNDASVITNGGNSGIVLDSDSTMNIKSNYFKVQDLATAGLINSNDGTVNNDHIIEGNLAVLNSTVADPRGTSLNFDSQADFTIDMYARNNAHQDSDTYKITGSVTSSDTTKGATIYIPNWELLGDLYGADAPTERYYDFKVFDASSYDSNITFASTDKEVLTPIGWYGLHSMGEGSYRLQLDRYNPTVFRGQVATVAQYANQLTVNNVLFDHVDLVNQSDMIAQGQMGNRYASDDPQFAPYLYDKKKGGIWFKSYANFENIGMGQGFDVRNYGYGALIGVDLDQIELSHGWKLTPTFYAAYNGAHQTYEGIGIYENGGQLGAMGTFTKGNFIGSILGYGGGYGTQMNGFSSEHDNAGNWFAGAATKLAYNFKLPFDLYLQPTALVSYNAFGQQNWETSYGMMSMNSGMLNGINVAPGLNLIWNKKTFSIYATTQMMFNIMGGADGQAGNVSLPTLQMGTAYFEYGLGFRKTFKDRFSCYLQATARAGSRLGGAIQGGLEYRF